MLVLLYLFPCSSYSREAQVKATDLAFHSPEAGTLPVESLLLLQY